MAELKLPSAGKGEFPRLVDGLAEVEALLDASAAAIGGGALDASAPLDAFARAKAQLQEMRPRAEIFEKRAAEKDEDKKIYGPKMVAKVVDFCAALTAAEEREKNARLLDKAMEVATSTTRGVRRRRRSFVSFIA